MKDYSRLYSDILFYTKEFERAKKEIDDAKKSGASSNVLTRLEREFEKIKMKYDSLCAQIPEEHV